MTPIIQIIVMILLLVLSAYFSGSETALTTVSRFRMKAMAKDGDRRAATVLKVTDQKDKMLSAILIGNNIVNLSASSIATSLALHLFGDAGAGIATGILTFLILIFGEITPKTSAQENAVSLSLRNAPSIWFLMWFLTPAIFVVNHISSFIIRVFVRKNGEDTGLTEDELRTIVNVSSEKGVIEQSEKKFINNIFDFTDSDVKEVMIPRIDVTMADVSWTREKLIDVFRTEMYTRMPVYENTEDNIIGIINVKDLLLPEEAGKEFSIRNYLREAYFTYEQKNVSELFSDMRKNSVPMAVVLDEYGAVAGIVTLEDLLEELVGEIRDEYDTDEEDDIVRMSDREFIVLGSMNLDDLSEILPLGFSSEDYDTIGGYLTGLFDHVPKAGETYVTKDGVLLTVIKSGHHRVEKIRIRFPENPFPEKPEGPQKGSESEKSPEKPDT